MEQNSLVGPGFCKTPLGRFRQSILVDSTLSALQANAGFRECYHQLGHGLNPDAGRYFRIDVLDARLGMMTCCIFMLPRGVEEEFDWIAWSKAVGIPVTDANFQHNVRLQVHPVVNGHMISKVDSDEGLRELIRVAMDPITRYGYLGRYEDLDIILAARSTPLELIIFGQYRL